MTKKYTLTITADASAFYAIEGALIQAHSHCQDMLDDKTRAELDEAIYANMPPEFQPQEMTEDRRRSYEKERDGLDAAIVQIDAFLKANGIDEIRE